jgi:hypothetical protein
VGGCKSPPTPTRELNKMQLAVFIKKQLSDDPYMCINQDHAMPLVAKINIEMEIELKCFTGYCDFKIKPGINTYEKLLKEFPSD